MTFERPDVEPRHVGNAHSADGKGWQELSKEERQQLRQELKAAPVLDFQRYLSDIDYQLHIFENPAMHQIQDDIIANALMCIQDNMPDLNLSSEQMGKIVAIFEPGVRKRMADVQGVENEMRSLLRRAINRSEANHPEPSDH